MSTGKKIAIGIASLLPAIFLGIALWALLSDGSEGLFYGAIALSGLIDSALGVVLLPHVHDNKRIRNEWRIAWVVGLGLPYLTVAPIYWLLHILPDHPAPEGEEEAAPGGAWYADPWGQAPFRWWDGRQWTDWVTGPPAGGA